MEKESKMYEIGYLISPHVPTDKINDEVASLRKVLEDKKCLLISEGEAKMRKLAYTVEKKEVGAFDDAYFGWVRFFADPSVLVSVKKTLEGTKDILRFLIIKLDKEEPKKTPKKPVRKTREIKDVVKEEKLEVKDDEVDKKLDEILGEEEKTDKNADIDSALDEALDKETEVKKEEVEEEVKKEEVE